MSELTSIQKTRIALYYFLLGKGWSKEAEIMDWAENIHSGVRKDGVTPEFAHQIWIANYLRTLPLNDDMMRLCIAIAFLHDTAEDFNYNPAEFSVYWGGEIAEGAKRLTKKWRGVTMPEDTYFFGIGETAQSALVKGVDRLHNLSTMVGVFKLEKMVAYIEETKQYHLPMLKAARKRFPQYEAAFENIKQSLLSRIELISAFIEVQKNAK